MNATSEASLKAVSPVRPVEPDLPTLPSYSAEVPTAAAVAWTEYLVDAFQRSVLFLELLRHRGNEEMEIRRGRWQPYCCSTMRC